MSEQNNITYTYTFQKPLIRNTGGKIWENGDKCKLSCTVLLNTTDPQTGKYKVEELNGVDAEISGLMTEEEEEYSPTGIETFTFTFVSDKSISKIRDASLIFYADRSGGKRGILIDSTDENGPYIDVYNGEGSTTMPKVRLGNLSGIQDNTMPDDGQPSGYGLYSDNVYLRGAIYASSGKIGSLTIGALEELTTKEGGEVRIDGGKIAAGSVTANQIAANTITADQIASNTITADQIASNTITVNELASDVGKELDITSNEQINMIVSGATPVGAVETSGIEIKNNEIKILSAGSISIESANKIYIGTGTLESELKSKYNIATISLYIDSADTPTTPVNSHTYDFTTQSFGNEGTVIEGWSTIYPTTIQNNVYVTTAKISSNESTTKNVTSSDWSAPTLYVKNGRDGTSFNIKGSKTSYDLLPNPSTQEIGDAYIISGSTDPETEGHIFIVTDDGSGRKWVDGGKIQGEKGTDGRSMISMIQQYILSVAEPTPYANWQNTIPEKTSSDANKQYYSRYLIEWAGNEAKTFYNGDMPGFNAGTSWSIPTSSRLKAGLKYNIIISLDEPSEYNVDFYFRQSSTTRNKIGHLNVGDTTSTFDAIGYSNIYYIRQTASSSNLTYHLTITSYDNTYSWTDPIVAVDINNAEQAKKDAAAAAISAANAETKAQQSLDKAQAIIDGTEKAQFAKLMEGTKISINPEEKVNVKSGGLIDVVGGKLNIASGSSIDMAANSDMNLAAGGSINIYSGETQSGLPINAVVMNNQGIAVESNGMIVVDGGEIVVKDNSDNALVMNNAGIVIDSGAAVVIKDGLNDAISMDSNGIALSSDAKIELTSGNEIIIASSSSSHTGNAVTIDGEGITLAADGKINIGANSGIDVSSGGNIHISNTGTFTIDSTNFSINNNGDVSITGNVEAKTGNIGGWNITDDNLVSTVITPGAGTKTYKTGMSPIDLNEEGTALKDSIVFYAGEQPSGSTDHYPFEVHADGTVYLKAIYTVNSQGTPVKVNLTNYPFWKLSEGNTITGWTVGQSSVTINTTGGDINFNKATTENVAIRGAGGGPGQYGFEVITLNEETPRTLLTATINYALSDEPYSENSNVKITGIGFVTSPPNISVPVGDVYTAGYNAGKNVIGLSANYGLVSGTITVTDTEDAPKTLTVSAPTALVINEALSTAPYTYVLNVTAGDTTIFTRRLDASGAYEAGEDSVTVSTISNPSNLQVSQDHTISFDITATASNDASKTEAKSINATSVYESGQKNVTLTAGDWDNGRAMVVNDYNENNYAYVYLPNSTAISYNPITLASTDVGESIAKSVTINIADTTRTTNLNIDTTAVYNAGGATANLNQEDKTLDYGESITISPTYINSSGNTIAIPSRAITITAPSDAPTPVVSSGWNNGVYSVTVNGTTRASTTVSATYGSWAEGSIPIYVYADGNTRASSSISAPTITSLSTIVLGASDLHTEHDVEVSYAGTTSTKKVHVEAGAVYTAGQDSVTLSQGDWSIGQMIVSASNGKTSTVSAPAITNTTWTNTTGDIWRADVTYGGIAHTGTTKDFSSIRTEGANSVTLSGGSWSEGTYTVTASNEKTFNVSVPTATLTQSAWTSAHEMTVSATAAGVSIGSSTVDASNVYNSVTISSIGDPTNLSIDASHVISFRITAKASNGNSDYDTKTINASSVYNSGVAAGEAEFSEVSVDTAVDGSSCLIGYTTTVVTAKDIGKQANFGGSVVTRYKKSTKTYYTKNV